MKFLDKITVENEIEKLVHEKDMTYIEAVTYFFVTQELDIMKSNAKKYLTPKILNNIVQEAVRYKLLDKESDVLKSLKLEIDTSEVFKMI